MPEFIPACQPLPPDIPGYWLLFCTNEVLLSPEGTGVLWSTTAVSWLGSMVDRLTVGYWDGIPVQVVRVHDSPAHHLRISLRQLVLESGALQGLVVRAAQILRWSQDHRFCARCGGVLQDDPLERVRHCYSCSLQFYPIINPCIIVLVRRGADMLLAQGVRFVRPFFSCLAGFIEAGETAEETVHREVYEETGICINNVQYVSSQSWPFPHSLMLGFEADYASGQIQIDPQEIVQAQWVHALDAVETAPVGSIAHLLIERHRRRYV